MNIQKASSTEVEAVNENIYTIGGLELNDDTKEVSVDGNPVRLTPIEFKILGLLIKNPWQSISGQKKFTKEFGMKLR